MKVGHSVQPHDIDPVGHKVEVEHGQGPQGYCETSQDSPHANEEAVGCLDLQVQDKTESCGSKAPCNMPMRKGSDVMICKSRTRMRVVGAKPVIEEAP